MKYLKLNNDLEVSQLVFGCMRISEMSVSELDELIQCALEEGINFFDHADIYGGGKSEVLFGEVLKLHPEYREKMIIQSKCAIRKGKVGYYDFSKEHIIYSVKREKGRILLRPFILPLIAINRLNCIRFVEVFTVSTAYF